MAVPQSHISLASTSWIQKAPCNQRWAQHSHFIFSCLVEVQSALTIRFIHIKSLAVHVAHRFPVGNGLFSSEESKRWKELKSKKINICARQFRGDLEDPTLNSEPELPCVGVIVVLLFWKFTE